MTIGEVIRVGLANKWKIAIYGSEKDETASYDTEGEKALRVLHQ